MGQGLGGFWRWVRGGVEIGWEDVEDFVPRELELQRPRR